MKRIALVAAALAILVSCGPKSMFSGHIRGIEDGRLMFVYSSDGDSGQMAMDTVILGKDGSFRWDPPVAENGILMIVDPARFIDYQSFSVYPGQQCVIEGTLTDYEVSGSRFYKDWGVFQKMTAGNAAARHDLMASIPEEEDPDYDMAEYSAKDRALKEEWDAIAIDFIKQNPGSEVCAYLAHELSKADDFYEVEEIISPEVKKGPMGYLIEKKSLALDAEALRQASAKDIYEGAVAPDFSLPTSTDGTFTLSEYRGRYVLLDFWGTWCGWCIEGLPTVKNIAHSYADRLTVVSVDTRDPKQAWLKGIEEYGMDWVQVYNSDADAIDAKYAVQGFPGFYLIDPEGIIRMIAFGEPAHFVEKIGELISE